MSEEQPRKRKLVSDDYDNDIEQEMMVIGECTQVETTVDDNESRNKEETESGGILNSLLTSEDVRADKSTGTEEGDQSHQLVDLSAQSRTQEPITEQPDIAVASIQHSEPARSEADSLTQHEPQSQHPETPLQHPETPIHHLEPPMHPDGHSHPPEAYVHHPEVQTQDGKVVFKDAYPIDYSHPNHEMMDPAAAHERMAKMEDRTGNKEDPMMDKRGEHMAMHSQMGHAMGPMMGDYHMPYPPAPYPPPPQSYYCRPPYQHPFYEPGMIPIAPKRKRGPYFYYDSQLGAYREYPSTSQVQSSRYSSSSSSQRYSSSSSSRLAMTPERYMMSCAPQNPYYQHCMPSGDYFHTRNHYNCPCKSTWY